MSIALSTATDRETWLAERRKGIGASESAIVLGLRPSRLKLYLRKRGELPEDEPTEEMEWGLRLEDDIVDAYEKKTGRRIVATQVYLRHPEWPSMAATVDGITECGRVVEFKAIGLYGVARDLGDDGESETLPDHFVVQTNQEIAVAGACGLADGINGDVAIFGAGLRFRVFPVRHSDALTALVADAIRRFLEDHVIPGIPPDEIAPGDAEHVIRAFRRDSGEILELGEDVGGAAALYVDLGQQIRELEQFRDEQKARILMAIGHAAGAALPGGWEVARKVVKVNNKAREAFVSEQIRLTVKGPK